MKRGDKFKRTFTTRFGKEITEIIIIVCISGNNILMDNGQTFHKTQLI
tara:strand:+ start:1085 stop:1228 length:144 start_codon:yes stop_codon:yes gene_type:complete